MPYPTQAIMPLPQEGYMLSPHQGLMPLPHEGYMLSPHQGLMPPYLLGHRAGSSDCKGIFELCKARNKAHKKAHKDRL